MHRRFSSLSGFVLAGGTSRRMGQPKPSLVLAGETLIERQIRVLRSVCGAIGVIGDADRLPKLADAVLPDAIPDRGPLGGIYTGLLHTRTDFSLFLACDLPCIGPRFLAFLARQAAESRADATVPEAPGFGIQPACAIYRRRALPVVRARLRAHLNKSQDLIDRLRARVIPWREIARAGFSPSIFANINTWEDYEAAKRILGAGS